MRTVHAFLGPPKWNCKIQHLLFLGMILVNNGKIKEKDVACPIPCLAIVIFLLHLYLTNYMVSLNVAGFSHWVRSSYRQINEGVERNLQVRKLQER
jgi:hypothetical protein